MVRIKKRVLCLLMATVLVLGICGTAMAASEKDLSALVKESAEYTLNVVEEPQVGSAGGEWAVLGLARSGYSVPQEYWDNYYTAVEEYVKACNGVLHKRKYREYSRVVIALTAIGAEPTNVAGYNLLKPLGDFDKTVWQGINGPIWALIAFDSGNYDVPINAEAKTQATRQMYIDEILNRQLEDGGWNLTDNGGSGKSDPDVTGMALQALAKYQDQAKVKSATDKALICLSERQNADGGYSSYDVENSESVAQVIVALCELGVDLSDSRFVKNGNTMLDNLLSYRKIDGSFIHILEGNSDIVATEQGLYSIVAALRAKEGKNSLYRMDDCNIRVSGNTADTGLDNRHADVKKTEMVAAGKTFEDIFGHVNQTAIEALVAREIINGMTDYSYEPDETMTRAQFATIVVKSLGLTPKSSDVFTDVPAKEWYAPYVGTAYAYGIVNGRTDTTFEPTGTINRQEAAAMVARAAKLCGMDTAMENNEIRDMLAQFGDYKKVSDWAKESMAFCYSEDILDQSDLDIEPGRMILRCEIAQMLYNMLDKAKLL